MSDITAKSNAKSGLTVSQIAVIGVMTAATCVLAPLSLPIGPVPISADESGNLFFTVHPWNDEGNDQLSGLPAARSCRTFRYFPVSQAALESRLGPTGGYLIGFIPMAIIAGLVIDRYINKRIVCLLGMIAGTAVCYLFGTAWLAYQAKVWAFRLH